MMLTDPFQRAFGLLTFGIFLLLLVPAGVQDGMFMDGELYAAVAHNQAHGMGSFWFPWFSQAGFAGLSTFHEHPPLTFGLQASWFWVFGSGFWVERLYAFCCALVTAWLMLRLWREVVPAARPEQRMGWWAVLLWIMVPTVFWCYANNMMENTMGVFTTAAVLAIFLGSKRHWWFWHSLAGVAVFLAAMAKGLPGLFPIAAPFLIALALNKRDRLKGFGGSVLVGAVTVALFGLLLLWPEAERSLMTYVDVRLLHRIAEVPTVESRFATLEMLIVNLIGPLVLALFFILVGRRSTPVEGMGREAMALAMIGLSGTLPLMLTMVQKSFYMAAALPMVAMAIALWSAPFVSVVLRRWMRTGKVLRWVAGVGLAFSSAAIIAGIVFFGRAGRDGDLLHDVHAIGELVPEHSLVGVPDGSWQEWSLQTYLIRYHFVSLEKGRTDLQWYLTAKGMNGPGDAFEQVPLDLRTLVLWQQRQP